MEKRRRSRRYGELLRRTVPKDLKNVDGLLALTLGSRILHEIQRWARVGEGEPLSTDEVSPTQMLKLIAGLKPDDELWYWLVQRANDYFREERRGERLQREREARRAAIRITRSRPTTIDYRAPRTQNQTRRVMTDWLTRLEEQQLSNIGRGEQALIQNWYRPGRSCRQLRDIFVTWPDEVPVTFGDIQSSLETRGYARHFPAAIKYFVDRLGRLRSGLYLTFPTDDLAMIVLIDTQATPRRLEWRTVGIGVEVEAIKDACDARHLPIHVLMLSRSD